MLENNGRKTIAGICFVFFLCFVLTGCTPSDAVKTSTTLAPAETTTAFDLNGYKDLISECNASIYDASILLSNMGQWEYNYWKNMVSMNGVLNYDLMAQKAEDWLNEKAEVSAGTVKENYDAICESYRQIIKTEIEGKEAEKILETFDELFVTYSNLYLLVTSPSGSINIFADSFNDYTNSIKNNNSLLDTLTEKE